jgi:hypothetical protein
MYQNAKEVKIREVTDTAVILDIEGTAVVFEKAGALSQAQAGETAYLVPFTKSAIAKERAEVAKELLNTLLDDENKG